MPINKWSTNTKNALNLTEGGVPWDDPKLIALSLKNPAENRKGSPFQSAMSMLNFYLNRAGKNLPEEKKKVLKLAKEELQIAVTCY